MILAQARSHCPHSSPVGPASAATGHQRLLRTYSAFVAERLNSIARGDVRPRRQLAATTGATSRKHRNDCYSDERLVDFVTVTWAGALGEEVHVAFTSSYDCEAPCSSSDRHRTDPDAHGADRREHLITSRIDDQDQNSPRGEDTRHFRYAFTRSFAGDIDQLS